MKKTVLLFMKIVTDRRFGRSGLGLRKKPGTERLSLCFAQPVFAPSLEKLFGREVSLVVSSALERRVGEYYSPGLAGRHISFYR